MSLCDRLAAYFHAREGQWVDAHDLLQVAGFAAWRTRLSELRRPPYAMDIRNRTRRVVTVRGEKVTVSEYRFQKAIPASLLEVAS